MLCTILSVRPVQWCVFLLTGAEITSTFDNPECVKLGHCDLIEEIMIGEDRLIKFSGTINIVHVFSSVVH